MEKYEGYYVRITLHEAHLELQEGFVHKNRFHRERTIPYNDLSDVYVSGRILKKLVIQTNQGDEIECDLGRVNSQACWEAIQRRLAGPSEQK